MCGAVLFSVLSEEQLLRWGWRVPFVFSLLIIPVGLYIRAHISDTYCDDERSSSATSRHPAAEIVKKHFSQFLLAILMIMPATLLTYIIVFYMPAYLKQTTATAPAFAYAISAGASVVMIAGALISGIVCDRLARRKPFAVILLLVTLVSSFTVFAAVGHNAVFLMALVICVAALGMLMTVQALMIMEAFPRHVRASAMSVSYSVGVTLFGGTAQMVVTKLMVVSGGHPMAPFWYLGIMLVIAVFAYAFFDETRYV